VGPLPRATTIFSSDEDGVCRSVGEVLQESDDMRILVMIVEAPSPLSLSLSMEASTVAAMNLGLARGPDGPPRSYGCKPVR
jgi:hypothetical protein